MTGRDGCREVLDAIDSPATSASVPSRSTPSSFATSTTTNSSISPEFARPEALSFRFIEFMPLDSGRTWLRDLVVPGRDLLARLQSRFDLVPVTPADAAETARRWRFGDLPKENGAEIGIIAPVTEPFCGHCNRIRLTADGQIRTCLFSLVEHDLKKSLREGADDALLERRLREIVRGKEDRHHIGEPGFEQPERSMSCIGG
jgi:cyclic pyranopterin phosphate synthase